MKMKIKDYSKRIFAVLFICVLMLNILATSAFAADGEAPFNDFTVSNSEYYVFADEYLTIETVEAIFAYYDLLYSYNMTNGMRLVYLEFRTASNQKYLDMYFVSGSGYGATSNEEDVFVSSYYFSRSSGTPDGLCYLSDLSGPTSVKIQKVRMLPAGNVVAQSAFNSGTGIGISSDNFAYRSADGIFVSSSAVSKYNILGKNGSVDPVVVSNMTKLTDYISTLGGGGNTEIVINESLDIGSIITAYMTSYMSIFDGFFGFTIFGINIASTLISILVIGIVYFVVKLLSGK